jgi:PAS domain S-box-containing protein
VGIQLDPRPQFRALTQKIDEFTNEIRRRRAAEERLRLSYAYARSLIEATLDPLVTIGPDGKITDVNAATEAVTGHPRSALIGKEFLNFFTNPERARAGYEQVFREGMVRDYALEIRHRDGRVTPVLYNATVYRNEAGKVIGVFAAARDVTELKRAEEVLKDTAETLRAMSEAALDAIVTCDADGKVSYWNPAAARAFGYSAEEALGRDLHELFVPTRHHAAFAAAFRRFGETGQGRILDRTLELEAVRKDGTEFPVELSVSPLRLKGRWAAVGILRDVSERKRVESHLRQSQKLESIARLAGGVAHDFNNLLTAILSGIDEILSGLPEPHPLRQEAQEIEAAARKAATLTRQLLVFSRKEVVEPVVLDLNEILAGVGKMLRRIIGEDVELVTVPHATLGRVRADPGQMEQVIVNLAVNARDAMPKGGRLVIETSNVELGEEDCLRIAAAKPGAYVLLAVSDTGCGMDAEVQSHLFEPFFTTKAAGKGTGLGLSTVYGIVTQADGFVSVYSEPGKGSVFKVYLPRTEEAMDADRAALTPPPAARGTETVLLVEDDPLVRRVAVNALAAAGYAVLQAGAGNEALRVAAAAGRVDLLVTDLVMPHLGGEDLAGRLRRERPALPVLFVSGYTEQGLAPGTLSEGASYLQKPFTPAALTRAVRDLLDRRAQAASAPPSQAARGRSA